MSNLRYVIKNGEKILQMEVEDTEKHASTWTAFKWIDVPLVEIYPKVPREFYINKFKSSEDLSIKYSVQTHDIGTSNTLEMIHVTEIPTGYKLISKDNIEKAMKNLSIQGPLWEQCYNNFLNDLGFD